MKTNSTNPALTRCLWQQGFRDALQRLTVTLMLVMLTATTAWAVYPTYTLTVEPNYSGASEELRESFMVQYDGLNGNYNRYISSSYFESKYNRGAEWKIIGWSTTADGAIEYEANTTVILTGDLTLYAKWANTEQNYIVTFHASGGIGTMAAVAQAKESDYTIPACGYTRSGYTFVAWATSPGGDTVYQPGHVITSLSSDLNLYAKWELADITISFDANGGEGSMDAVLKVSGSSYEIPACGFTRNGYAFIGWATSPSGAAVYQPGDVITSLTNDLTLYAKWAINPTVTFYANGGEGSMDAVTQAYGSSYEIPFCDFTRNGYYFIGWATSAGGNVAYQPGDIITSLTADLTLYAKWNVNPTVTFYANGGEGSMDAVRQAYGSSYEIPSCSFTRVNNTFIGWATTSDGNVAYQPGDIITSMTADLTLYAKWAINPTVTFYANDGEGSMDAVRPNYGSNYEIPSCSFTRVNYTFIGWATTSDGNVTYQPGDIITSMTADLTLYAKWAINPTVTFYANGGEGSMDAVRPNYESNYIIPPCSFSRVNYTFIGWATSPNGSVVYTPGNKITLTTDLMLYAKWGAELAGLKYVITSENSYEVELIGYDGDKPTGTLAVLSSITIGGQDYSVSSIGKRAFQYCDGLTAITFPSTSELTSIGDGAFYACSGLTTIDIPDGVTIIGDATFQLCSNLATISIPNSLTSIRDCAFDNTPWKRDFLNSQPDGVVYIGKVAYTYKGTMPENTDIVLATETKGIAASAFNNQSNLKSITIPSSVTSIGRCAFNKCSGLAAIVVDNGNTVYDSRDGCNAIIEKATNTLIAGCKNTVIPKSVTSIGDEAFYGCTGLISITIPNSVTSIGEWVFAECTDLKSITIPNSVTSIGESVFWDCTSLETVTIGSGVTSIGVSTFDSCWNLFSLTIPASVTSIGRESFWGCRSLKSVTIFAPKLNGYGGDAFANNADDRKIYVFSDCVDIYKYRWSQYADAIEAIPALVVHDAGGELGSWCTYYNGLADVTVADGTTVYTAKRNNAGGVTLTETGSRIVKKGEAVLLKSTADVVLSSAASAGTGVYTGNELKGVDYETAQDANTTYYVLSKPAGKDFGFYKLKNTVKLGANKAYLAVANSTNAPEFIGFGDSETTNISNTDRTDYTDKNSTWYDLQGRKIANGQKPKAKGLYILNGRKFIIK